VSIVHIVVAVREQLQCDLLRALFEREGLVHTFTAAPDEIAAAVGLHRLFSENPFSVDDTVVAIVSAEEDDNVPAACARLLTEFSELVVVTVCWKTGMIRLLRSRIDVTLLPGTLLELVTILRDSGPRIDEAAPEHGPQN
jgi:hypothetical protein